MPALCPILLLLASALKTAVTVDPTTAPILPSQTANNTSTLSCARFASDPSDIDIYRFCRIFEPTNVFELLDRDDLITTDGNSWYYDYNFEIVFDKSNNIHSITKITLTDDYFGGKLITSRKWPQHLEQIDLETPGDKTDESVIPFEGVWDWSTITELQHLSEFSLMNNNFSGTITNEDWNQIFSMPSLKVLVLARNYFKSNFSEIHIRDISPVYELQLMDNLLFGHLDTTLMGFFSKFPKLQIFVTDNNPDLGGHFANFDALSLCRSLNYFEIGYNQFSGFLTLSDDSVTLPSGLSYFEISHNEFGGPIDWNMFEDLRWMHNLLLSHNHFEGMIDWKIVGHLSNMSLRVLALDGNRFDGFANFEYIVASSTVKIRLDRDVMCDPAIYVCDGDAVAANRSSVECEGKAGCESTCKCSDGSIPSSQKTSVEGKNPNGLSKHSGASLPMVISLIAVFSILLISLCVFGFSKYVKRRRKMPKPNEANYRLINVENA